MASFEHLLAECLETLNRTGAVEASLASHPEQVDQLRPLLEMAQATQAHYQVVPPPPGALAVGREKLLAEAARHRLRQAAVVTQEAPRKSAGGMRLRLAFSLRLIALVLAVGLVAVFVGSGLVWAAGESLPGHLLYPLKLATEDVRLTLASGPAAEVDLLLGFVEERASEIQSLATAGSEIPSGPVLRMERQVDRALTWAAGADDENMVGLLGQIATRTQEQAQRLDGLQTSAPQQAQTRLGQAAAICRHGAEAAEQGLSDPATFRRRYRHSVGEPEPMPEPEQRQQRNQQQNQHKDDARKPAPTGTATETPRSRQASPTPRVTTERSWATPSPQPSSTREHKRAEPTNTPVGPPPTPTGTPTELKGTPHHSDVTLTPEPTSYAPRATDGPQPTSQSPHATATPQPVPQDPPPTPGQPRKTPGPKPPGGGNGGGH